MDKAQYRAVFGKAVVPRANMHDQWEMVASRHTPSTYSTPLTDPLNRSTAGYEGTTETELLQQGRGVEWDKIIATYKASVKYRGLISN